MDCINEYKKWVENADSADSAELKKMSDDEIRDAFYRSLEFGTGGLRGIMGLGTNRMNVYTVRRATQGLAYEIIENGGAESGVAIAYDSRINSKEFAFEAARVLCANGIKTYLFDELRPTPELSFAVRFLGCARGIVITASHNPKEYNGYKVYGSDGGQIPPSVADSIIKYINRTDIFGGVKLCNSPDVQYIGKEVDTAYIDAVYRESMNVPVSDNFKVVYTPLHGSGNKPVRRILEKIGVKNIFVVPEQELPDGRFPTVKSPNPENIEAFDIATKYAKEHNADLVFGTDPDSDRIGVVVKTADGSFKVLNGNQTGTLLCGFILRKMRDMGKLRESHTIVKTIVTTEAVRKIAVDYGIDVIDVLTGFKYIGEKIKEFETRGDREFLFGLEESYGYLKGTYARDKDAVVAAMLICEMAADYKTRGRTLYDGLIDIYKKYGFVKSGLVSKTLQGIDGAGKIRAIMQNLRQNSPKNIGEYKVCDTLDYLSGYPGMPKSDVLKFFLDKGWFAVRPSGTEPKIKFYYELECDENGCIDSSINKFIDNLTETHYN